MELTLVFVTLMSLGMAVAMGAVAWRLLREERRRSDARVAALAEMARPRSARGRAAETSRKAAGGRGERNGALGSPPIRETPSAAWDSLPMRPFEPGAAPAPVATQALFAPPSPSSRLGARLLALSAAALVMAAGVWGVWRLADRDATGAPPAAVGVPIELVSLASDRQGDALRITGLVQNPTNGREQHDIVAVAFLFDRSGRAVGSGEAPIEDTRLGPGEASPFVIVVDHAASAARYRLGFRGQDGNVLAHVDRRGDAAAESDARPAGAAHAQSD